MIEHMYFFEKRKKISGFSTPEVLLSCFILAIGLVTIVAVLSGSLRYSQDNRNVIVASELAQEGIELVRNIRDNNFASSTGFTIFSSNVHCRADWNDAVSSLDCLGAQGIASRYYLQYINGAYEHSTATKEQFSRYIYVSFSNTGGERAIVRSFVYWGNSAHPADLATGNTALCTLQDKCVFTESFLTAWH